MAQLIDKDALVTEIKKLRKNNEPKENKHYAQFELDVACGYDMALDDIEASIDTLEVKDPYEQCVQYDSIKAGIQAHAETYSFNIESELFNQLTKEQQALWRKEIERACISGGEIGVELARDPRYKENLEMKEDNLFTEKKIEKELADSWIDRVDRKRIPIELKGELKAKFKNEFHTMWQTVGALQFANADKHIMERLCLHFAAWGVYNLKDIGKISLKEKQKMDVEVKEVDLEKEWKEYFKYRGDVATVNIKHLAKHFFELGMSVSNVSK